MNNRITYVNKVDVTTITRSSIIEIGDSDKLAPTTRIIAIQREKAIFFGNELPFADYPMFREEIPQPNVYEQVAFTRENESPFIHVENIHMRNIAASSILHLGSTETIEAEARVKNIRHLLREKDKR